MKVFKALFALTIIGAIALVGFLGAKPAQFTPAEQNGNFDYAFLKGEIVGTKQVLENGDIEFIVEIDGKERDVLLSNIANFNRYREGDEVLVYKFSDRSTFQTTYEISDYYHQSGLLWIFLIFATASAIIARKKGLTAIASVIISLGLFYAIFLKMITVGYSPISSAITFILIVTIITIPIIHGFNKKSLSATVSIIVGYALSLGIALLFKELAQTGNTPGEDFRMLGAMYPDIDFAGIVIASLFMGAVGALIDTAISISSAIFENIEENAKRKFKQVYKVGMEVGKDVLGSMINTLLFAYLASSLPFLILLAIDQSGTLTEIINIDFIALELTRTFVGALSLVIVIPIISVMSSYLIAKKG